VEVEYLTVAYAVIVNMKASYLEVLKVMDYLTEELG
jgi:hypothetical protein